MGDHWFGGYELDNGGNGDCVGNGLMAKDTFSFRMSGEMRRRLFEAAEADRRSVGDWVRLLIERELGSRGAVEDERGRMVGMGGFKVFDKEAVLERDRKLRSGGQTE